MVVRGARSGGSFEAGSTWIPCILIAVLVLSSSTSAKDVPRFPYRYHRLGSAADVARGTMPGMVLMGGDTEVDEAMRWLCERSQGGDFLVLRTTGSDDYNPYIAHLCPDANSVATLVLPDTDAAVHPDAAAIVSQAEAIWLAGGDQSDYLRGWTGTPVQRALQARVDRGVPVGGTSAGLNVLTSFVYGAERGPGVTSRQALADPYDDRITLRRDFISIPQLAGTLGDPHFRGRDRMGRQVAFLCRLATDGWAARPQGIAVDEKTALLIDETGNASVVGSGSVYFLRAPGVPEVCGRGVPVTYRDIDVYRVDVAANFDLSHWSGQGGTAYQVTAEVGVLTATQAGDSVY